MNKIYKVVWSKTKNCYVVASEFASRVSGHSTGTLNESARIFPISAVLAAIVLTAGVFAGPNVQAADANDAGIRISGISSDGKVVASQTGTYSSGYGSKAIKPYDYKTPENTNNIWSAEGPLYSNARTFGVEIGHSTSTADANNSGYTSGVAIGDYAQSNGGLGVAVGTYAQSKDIGAVAVGTAAKAQGFNSLAMMRQSSAVGDYSAAIGTAAYAKGTQSLAVGSSSTAEGNQAIAIGSANQTTHQNSSGVAYSEYTSENNTSAKGNRSIAIGAKARTTADNTIALGTETNATAINGIAIGNGATVNHNGSVALGSNSETAAAVKTASMSINGVTKQFAGVNPTSTVSVGSASNERTITNVAAGRVSATSTDAINGSQLYGVVSEVDKGVKFAGDAGNTITQKLGATTNIKGGATNLTTDNNIGVVSNGSDTLSVKLAKNVNLGNDGSLTIGSTVLNNNGLSTNTVNAQTVNANTFKAGNVSMSTTGINAGNTIITNVKAGVNATDAVNKSQLDEVKAAADTKVKGGKNINVTTAVDATTQAKTYTVNLDDTVTLGAGNTAIKLDSTAGTITTGTVSINGGTNNTVTGLSNTTWNVNNPTIVSGRAATEDQLKRVNDQVNVNTGNIATNSTKISQNTADISNNSSRITTINETVKKGLSFAGDAGEVNKKLGQTLDVKGNSGSKELTNGNIGVVVDYGVMNIKLAEDINLGNNGSVTIGNTVLNNNSLTTNTVNAQTVNADTFQAGNVSMSTTGINAGNTTITNVKAGVNATDAVNKSQLDAVINQAAAANTKVKGGKNINVTTATDATTQAKTYTVNLDDTVTLGTGNTAIKLDSTAGTITTGTVSINGGTNNTVTGLSNTAWDVNNPTIVSGRAATEDQLKRVNDQVKINAGNIADNSTKISQNTTNISNNSSRITTINETVNKGLSFAGDAGEVNKKLGDTLNVKGGATNLTDNNIGVVVDSGVMNVKLAKDVNLGNNGSITIGDTVLNNNSVTTNTVNAQTVNANTFKAGDVSLSTTGINAGNTTITNVKAGVNATDAVNKAQLDLVINQAAANKTIVKEGKNITVTPGIEGSAATYTVGLKDSVTIGSGATAVSIDGTNATVRTGDVNISGVTNTVTGLSNTEWNVNNPTIVSGRAATEDQLKRVNDQVNENTTNITNIDTKVGKGLSFAGDTGEVNKKLGDTLKVKGGATNLTDNNIGVVVDNGVMNVKLAKDVNLGDNGSVTIGNTVLNNNSLRTNTVNAQTVNANTFKAGDVSMSTTGINAGNTIITNVQAGVNATDAVNKSQLDAVINQASAANTKVEGGKNINVTTAIDAATQAKTYTVNLDDTVTLGAGNTAIKLDSTAGTITTGTVSINGGTNNTVTGLSNTEWNVNNPTIVSGRAATEDQLKLVNDQVNENTTNITNIDTKVGKGLSFAGDTGEVNKKLGDTLKVKGGATNLTDNNIGVVVDNGVMNVKLAKDVNLGNTGSVTIGNTVLNHNSVTTNTVTANTFKAGDVSMSTTGINAGNTTITNVKAGVNATDAVNKSQLDAVINQASVANTKVEGGKNINVTTAIDAATQAKTYTVNLDDTVTLGTGNTAIKLDSTAGTITTGTVSINGGTNNTVTGLSNTTWNVNNPTIVSGRAATEDQLKLVNDQVNINTDNIADNSTKISQNTTNISDNSSRITTINETVNKGLSFAGDTGEVNKKLGDTLKVKGGATNLTDNNIGVVVDSGVMNVKLAKDVNLGNTGSVTIGDTVLNHNSVTTNTFKAGNVSMSTTGINAGNTTITNVQAGVSATDAVNKSQLDAVINQAAAANTKVEGGKNINVTMATDAVTQAKTYTVNLDDTVTLGAGNTAIKLDSTAGTITTGTVSINGGTNNTVTGLSNTTWNVNNPTIVSGRAATEDQLKLVNDQVNVNTTNITNIDTKVGKGLSFAGDTGEVNKQLGDTLKVKGGATNLTDNNIGVVVDNGVMNVKLSKDVNLGNNGSLTVGQTTINATGINAGETVIKGVADGVEAHDAVNKSQLDKVAAAGNTKVTGSTNIEVKAKKQVDDSMEYNVLLKDKVVLGSDITGVTIDGINSMITVGGVSINGSNATINNLSNKSWNAQAFVSGQAATEDQLSVVDKKIDNTQKDLIEKGFGLKDNAGKEAKANLGETVAVVGTGNSADANYTGENIKTFVEDGKVVVKTDKNFKADSVTANIVKTGDTTVSTDGLHINNNISLTADAFNNGGNKITNIADGQDAHDAVNVQQLTKEVSKATTKVEGSDNVQVTEKVNGDGSKTYQVDLANKVTIGSGDKAIGIDGTTGTITTGNTTIGGNSVKTGDVVVNGITNTINGLSNTEWNPNNIVHGQAATEDQLKALADNTTKGIDQAKDELVKTGMNFAADKGDTVHRDLGETLTLTGDNKNITTTGNANGSVSIALNKDIAVDSVTATDKVVAGADGVAGTAGHTGVAMNGADGTIGLTGKVGADGTSAHATIGVEKGTGVDGSPVTNITYNDGNKDYTVATKDDGMNFKGDTGSAVSKKLNDTVNIIGGKTDAARVDNINVSSTDTGALKVNLSKNIGGLDNITVGTDPTTTKINKYGVTVTDLKKTYTTSRYTSDGFVAQNLKEGYRTAYTSEGWTIYPTSTPDNNSIFYAAPKNPHDAAVITANARGISAGYKQIKQVGSAFGDNVQYADQTDYVAVNKGDLVSTIIDGNKLSGNTVIDGGDKNEVTVALGNKTEIVGGGTKADDEYDNQNIKTIVSKVEASTQVDPRTGETITTYNGKVDVRIDKNSKFESLTTGDTVMNTNGITIANSKGNGGNVTLSQSGLDNGGNKIVNVAPGILSADSTDAVNGSQLFATNQRIDKSAAAAAALAGLSPLSYDPLNPTQVMAAVGSYHGRQALALGVAHYTKENTMIRAGATLGGSDSTMFNVGVSYKFGGSAEKKAIPERYKGGPISSVYVMQDEVSVLKAENARMKARDEKMTADYEALKRDNEDTKAKLAMLMSKLGM